jgi:hypothetical protein
MMPPNDLDSTAPTDVAREATESRLGGPIAHAAELFEIHALLQKCCDQTTDHCQAASPVVARQRGEIEALSEWLRRFETSLREARSHIDTLGVALDRIKIVALNTGLEGARLGDLAGKALIAVSDELRSLTSRGLELLSEQACTVEQMEADRQRLAALTESSQAQLGELESRLREALASEQLIHQGLLRFATTLRQSTGLDVEAAAGVSRVSEQARGLVESLASLAKSERQPAVRAALLPALEPLIAWLSSVAETKS